MLIRWSWFESCWCPCHMAQRVHTQRGWSPRHSSGGFSLFLLPFPAPLPPLVTVESGSSSINSTTRTGSSAGVNFTHSLQKQTLPFTVGIFLLSRVHTICKCWRWSVRLYNFEKDAEVFHASLVAILWTVLLSSFSLSLLLTGVMIICIDILQKNATKSCPEHLRKTWSMY